MQCPRRGTEATVPGLLPSARMCNSKPRAGTTPILIGVFALASGLAGFVNYSEVSARHFFLADDWAWLFIAEFLSYSEIFSFFPRRIYNDRPIGAMAIKALYGQVGLSHAPFLYWQVFVHGVNAVLLYLVSRKYVGHFAALTAAGLAAAWTVANGAAYWTAAVFDLLAATFCLLSIVLWQRAHGSRFGSLFVLGGAVTYFLALRTKEFAIGLPVLLLMMGWLLDRRPLARLAGELLPYLAVMGLIGARYADLLFDSNLLADPQNDPYGLHFGAVFGNLWFYFSKAFYADAFGIAPAAVVAGAVLVAASASDRYRRLLAVCCGGFAILLGPTLLLTNHPDPLYLYAPHYFLSLAIAALMPLGAVGAGAATVISLSLVVGPLGSAWLANIHGFLEAKSSANRQQFQSFLSAAGEIRTGSTFFITGLEPYFNPFSYGPGHSARIHTKDRSLKFVIELPRDQLVSAFCAAPSPKQFIAYDGVTARRETEAVLGSCASTGKETTE